jgi:hypothetical protein
MLSKYFGKPLSKDLTPGFLTGNRTECKKPVYRLDQAEFSEPTLDIQDRAI